MTVCVNQRLSKYWGKYLKFTKSEPLIYIIEPTKFTTLLTESILISFLQFVFCFHQHRIMNNSIKIIVGGIVFNSTDCLLEGLLLDLVGLFDYNIQCCQQNRVKY